MQLCFLAYLKEKLDIILFCIGYSHIYFFYFKRLKINNAVYFSTNTITFENLIKILKKIFKKSLFN